MTTTPELPASPQGEPNPAGGPDREAAIRAGVLKALGRPANLFRVSVTPLWADHFRVNVVTGEDASAVVIPNSYFVTADDRGAILGSDPPIRRQY
jgi:hypothetical protein